MSGQTIVTRKLQSFRADLAGDSIASEPLRLLSRSGKRIAGVYDHLRHARSSKGLIVIVSAYGKTKVNNLPLAYFLAVNGFDVIRYDHSNHVGDSEGTMLFTSLSQMAEDLESVIDFVDREFHTRCVGLLGSSLGARVALKHASSDSRVRLLISLIGVFNIEGTLRAIYKEDGFDEMLHGVPVGIRDIMGFQVDADHFLKDAYQHAFHSLQSSVDDASRLFIPTVFFVADRDPWVALDEVRTVFEKTATSQKDFCVLSGSLHGLYENPELAEYACRKVVLAANKYWDKSETDESALIIPDRNILAARLRQEKRRSSKDLNTDEEKKFWARYLEKYAYIVNLQDYWNLLEVINSQLGDWRHGEKILDAGCGIGNFGSFVLVRQMYRSMQGPVATLKRLPFISYIGVDFVPEAIRTAMKTHSGICDEFKDRIQFGIGALKNSVNFSYSVADLNRPLPFKTNSFDKICCNFVLSYVKDPCFTLEELFRTLKEGGRIALSSLKPHADLSEIYRNYVRVIRSEAELEQARLVLSNAGLITHKEEEGYYQFFSEADLETLLREFNIRTVRISRAFGNQANVAVAQKAG